MLNRQERTKAIPDGKDLYFVVSIIVPVYNVEKYLNRCLKSIADQTYSDLQIILVDDGSPDFCGKICDRWAEEDTRFSVIHQQNQGLSAARNAGLKTASGGYIMFVDSDDYLEITMVEKLLDAIERANADISTCQFIVATAGEEGKKNFNQTQEILINSSVEMIRLLLNGSQLTTHVWHYLFRRDILWDAPFEVGHKYEDQLFMVQALSRCNKMVLIPDALYYYQQNSEGIMGTYTVDNIQDWVRAKEKRADFVVRTYPELNIEAEQAYIDADLLCWSQFSLHYIKNRKELEPLLERTREDLKNRKGSWKNLKKITVLKAILVIYAPWLFVGIRKGKEIFSELWHMPAGLQKI